VNALVRPEDHTRAGFGAVKAALLLEARAVLSRRGIIAASCDGRDASLDEEIERQRTAGPRARPVHNDTWRRLRRGLRPKTVYHDTIVALAGPDGAPRNRAMLALLDAAAEPECYPLDEVERAIAAGR